MYNNYMYAIDRSDEYLAHYGVKGMRWGVRKAIKSGNSRKLDRAYRKAAKKLAKLEKRANNGSKYAKRAAVLGAGAAAAGGLAAVGTRGVADAARWGGRTGAAALGAGANAARSLGQAVMPLAFKAKNPAVKRALGSVVTNSAKAASAMDAAGKPVRTWGTKTGNAISRWGKGNSLATGATGVAANAINSAPKGVRQAMNNASRAVTGKNVTGNFKALKGVNNNTIARIGAGAVGAGLAAGAGYNAYRAATTKRAARKAAEFKSEMNKAFAGTKYGSNGGSRSNNQSGNSNSKRRRRR